MATTIVTKNSATSGSAPSAGALSQGELAVNVADKRLFTKDSGGSVVEVGTNPGGAVTFTAGSASAPAITTTGDTNTGIFFPAADTIAFAEGGTEAMRIDASGNLGLGVTPSAWGTYKAFQIGSRSTVAASASDTVFGYNWYFDGSVSRYLGTASSNLYIQNGTHAWYNAPSGTAGNAITFTQAMTLNASGNLMVGATSTDERLRVQSSASYQISFKNNSASGLGAIGLDGDNNFLFYGNTTERMRIDSGGNLIWGATSGGATANAVTFERDGGDVSRISIGGASSSSGTGISLYSSTAGTFRFYVSYAGQIHATSTSITAISDESLKENIRDLETGLSQVMALKPRRFDWKEETELEQKNVAGFIAQEVEEVLPELVYDYQYNKDEIKKSLKMGDMLPTLVKAIQELKAEVDSLKAQLENK